MSLTVDGFWNGRFWAESFWAAGFWYEPTEVRVPAVGPGDYPLSYAQPQRKDRNKELEIMLLLLG